MTAPVAPGFGGQPPPGRFVADSPKKVAQNVRRCLNAMYGHEDRMCLVYHREAFYEWVGTHWRELATETLSSMVYKIFETAVYFVPATNTQPDRWVDFDIDAAKLRNLIDGMKNVVLIDRDVNVPTWLDGDKSIHYAATPANEMIPCGNALVHAQTRSQYQHTPRLLNHFAVNYDFDPDAPRPDVWLRFLHELWPDDVESIETLQEIFGYLLTHRTDLQKMFMLIGPPRSGKGTIVRVLSHLMGGAQNVTSVSLADLNQSFGLEDVIGKTLAVMQDARFRSRDDGVAVERLLSITGEDPVSINRKNKSLLTVRLPVRFFLVSNEIPKMQDESGALRTRMILLKLRQTVDEGRRDPHLIDRLVEELPSILNWALDGLDRLASRRAFSQPKSALIDLDLLNMLSSPTLAFIEECCHLGPDCRVPKRELFEVWQAWCSITKVHPANEVHFARNLYAAAPQIVSTRPLVNGKGVTHFGGIEISEAGREILSGGVHWPGVVR